MNLYLISQSENNDYDTFNSAIVASPTLEEARHIHPSSSEYDSWENEQGVYGCWCSSPEQVVSVLIGKAIPGTPKGVILASYNAG